MKQVLLLTALLAAALLPALGSAAEAPVPKEQEALIAPTVVAQHEFALHLARALGIPLGRSEDPLRGLRALTALQIEPRGGWDPDAAMTPKVLAEVRQAVADAAAARRFALDPIAATGAFDAIVAQLALPRPAEMTRQYAQDQAPTRRYEGPCDPALLDYYYGAGGVPPYTYCRPPPAYFSMYAWVGSPFYWGPYYYPGYYALVPPYVIVYPPAPPPRFSEGVVGGKPRPTPVPPPSQGGTGFRDVFATQPAVPRAMPLPSDGRPRLSGGVLGGRPPAPGTAPIAPSVRTPATPSQPSSGVVPRAPAPPPAAPPMGRPSAPSAPPPAPAPGGGGRGWGDVFRR